MAGIVVQNRRLRMMDRHLVINSGGAACCCGGGGGDCDTCLCGCQMPQGELPDLTITAGASYTTPDFATCCRPFNPLSGCPTSSVVDVLGSLSGSAEWLGGCHRRGAEIREEVIRDKDFCCPDQEPCPIPYPFRAKAQAWASMPGSGFYGPEWTGFVNCFGAIESRYWLISYGSERVPCPMAVWVYQKEFDQEGRGEKVNSARILVAKSLSSSAWHVIATGDANCDTNLCDHGEEVCRIYQSSGRFCQSCEGTILSSSLSITGTCETGRLDFDGAFETSHGVNSCGPDECATRLAGMEFNGSAGSFATHACQEAPEDEEEEEGGGLGDIEPFDLPPVARMPGMEDIPEVKEMLDRLNEARGTGFVEPIGVTPADFI